MSNELGLFALMLAPVVSMISAYYSVQMIKVMGSWFNL
ncbi:hypothetical protein PCARR_b0726 [Pseudoalteromonas carrageenovora IAM 12662]|uniref:Uncharacterized protein n=1 Tax=Pseudoalteromonas carrageenovora IAM 12662 TaxID=1314868 RepID=A0ABR9EVW3_PSEVC|nr:hypothetical protein [Pseudoalteromonas carrageenovora IAM 12662]